MIPDYIDVMLGLLRRDAKDVGEQWRLLCDMLDPTVQRGLGLDTLPRPQRDLLVRSLARQVAQGLERLCGPLDAPGLGLATLADALRREETDPAWVETCEAPVQSWTPHRGRFAASVQRLAYDDEPALRALLYQHVPATLGDIKNALDALAGAFSMTVAA